VEERDMPIYEYECIECGEKFEEFCRRSDNKESDDKITCPNCGTEKVERVFSTFGTFPACGMPKTTSSFG
jgi:putative FmdB family regulatory protein